MAPKKKTESSVLVKIPKEKISKVKKPGLKVKIPFKRLKNVKILKNKSPAEVEMKKMLTKNPLNDIKLDRMNEVALAQLVKDCPVAVTDSAPAPVSVNESAPAPVAKKRGRKRKSPVALAQLVKDCPVAVTESAPAPVSVNESAPAPVSVNESAPAPVAKKRGRKRKSPEAAVVVPKKKPKKTTKKVAKTKSPKEAAVVVPKKRPKLPAKGYLKNLLPKKTTKKVAKTKSPKETAVVVPKKKPKLPKMCKVTPKKTTKKVAKTKSPKAPKRKAPKKMQPCISPPPKRPRGRPLKRPEPANDDSGMTSPSILSCSQTKIKTPPNNSAKTVARTPLVPNITENNESRRTSTTSALSASEFSWIRDISGSSTTTCITVTSKDLVRIDGKVPELKLTKLKTTQVVKTKETITQMEQDLSKDTNSSFMLKNNLLGETHTERILERQHSLSEDSSDSSSRSSRSSSRSSSSDKTSKENDLNLSISSITAPPYSPTYAPRNQSFDNTKQDEVTSILDMLGPKMKSMGVFSESEDEDYDKSCFEETISMHLKEEYNAILECSKLKQIVSESYLPNTTAAEIEQKQSEETDVAMSDHTAISDKSACGNLNDTPSNVTRRRDTYDSDDDDVLQLYATDNDLESSRMGSAASIFEEFVPRPLIQKPHTAVSYQPTKLDEPEPASAKKPVCEKQNADSTSIHKEPELDNVSNETPATMNETGHLVQKSTNYSTEDNPPLTISRYRFPLRCKGQSLSGACFFYMSSQCNRKDMCHLQYFPHRFIEENVVRMRISQFSEIMFIQEYNHIARWEPLRKKYVTCFIDECQRRDLPKILVEIVIDFLSKTPPDTVENKDLRVKVMEQALIHLNHWNWGVYGQLLEYNMGNEVLCEVFIKVIANTQNFSRFKTVFVNLTDFMVRASRTFDFGVACQILERVCILPFEAPLAMSLISIIGSTDKKIFKNSMTKRFELSLETCNKELYNWYLSIKTEGVLDMSLKPVSESGASLPPSLPSPCGSRGSKELEPLILNPNSSEDFEQRYTSPDTTNVDNVTKLVKESAIVRTFKHLSGRPPNTGMLRPPRPPPPPPYPRGPYHNWNEQTIISRFPRMPYMRQPRPMKRPMARPERPPSNFQRRYRPHF